MGGGWNHEEWRMIKLRRLRCCFPGVFHGAKQTVLFQSLCFRLNWHLHAVALFRSHEIKGFTCPFAQQIWLPFHRIIILFKWLWKPQSIIAGVFHPLSYHVWDYILHKARIITWRLDPSCLHGITVTFQTLWSSLQLILRTSEKWKY